LSAVAALPIAASWHLICALEDILPESGAAALVDGKEIALFRVRDSVFAIGNYDPASDANVLARGIVGDIGGEIVVASPIYKQHFSLITGRCLEEPRFAVPAYMAEVRNGKIWVLSAEAQQIVPDARNVKEAKVALRWKGRDARLVDFDATVRVIGPENRAEFEEIGALLVAKRQSVSGSVEDVIARWMSAGVILELTPRL